MKKLPYTELRKLFVGAKDGNVDDFKKIFESTYQSQYFLAYNYINDEYLAKEAVQNMYISFYNHMNDIKNDMAIIQWMNTSTINECKTLIKKENLNNKCDIEKFENAVVDTNLTPEESYKYKEEKDALNKALDKLDPELKEIIIYRYVDNLKVREISSLTSLSTATVNRYIKIAITKLRKYLEDINNKAFGLIFSPYVFRLFNNAMNKQVSNKQILDSYSRIAKEIVKDGTTIASSVLGTKLAASSIKKGTSTAAKIAIGTGTIATTAAVVAVAISPSYTISVLNDDYVLSQVISVSSSNIDQIRSISCYKDDELLGELNSDNNYSIEIEKNGQYTIIIKDIVGKTKEENIEIHNIDYECPSISVIKKDDVFEASVSDNKSGIDYGRTRIVNQDNENVEYNIVGNLITFTNNNKTTKLIVYDKLGNNKTVILNN